MMENDKEIIEQFVEEAKEHLDNIEDEFLLLEKQKNNPDRELVDKLFRSIHSIKGASGFLGLHKIGELSHVMETLLSMIRAGEIRPESRFIDAFLAGADLLSFMVDNIEQSNETDITKVHDRLASLLAGTLSPQIKAEMNTTVALAGNDGDISGFDITEFSFKNISLEMSLYVLRYDLMKSGTSPLILIKKLLNSGEIIDAKMETLSDNLNIGIPNTPLMYEVLYATKLEPEHIHQETGISTDQITQIKRKELLKTNKPDKEENIKPNKTKASKERLTDFANNVVSESESSTHQEQMSSYSDSFSSKNNPLHDIEKDVDRALFPERYIDHSNTIRIHVDVLDKLMRLAGELVLVRNQQIISMDTLDSITRSIAQRLDIVTTELHETIMQARMQPIGKIFGKFPRMVREFGKNLGKRFQIIIRGGNVELDKTILESLTDPLTHLIRNCCDHGLEFPEERKKLGKSGSGNIFVRAYHEAGQINIMIKDDGRGINLEIIRKKAIEMEIKSKSELDQMNDKEILKLILMPGFTTTEKVSTLSGRGVGMDVVRTSVEKLGGSLDIETVTGKGTTFHLRLPLTLAIIPSLIVSVGKYRYAIPQINLVELVCLYDEDVRKKIECAGDQEVYRLRDTLLPMVWLSEVLARPTPFTGKTKAEITQYHHHHPTLSEFLNFAVVRVGKRHIGLIIDQVIGTEEIVVKPMHPMLKHLLIYSGATIMGDGKVALILDIEGIAKHTGITFDRRGDTIANQPDNISNDEDSQTVLLFKYGEKEWFAISLPLIRRIERISVSKIEQIGNKEFITINGISTFIVRPNKVLNVSENIKTEEMFLILPKYIKRPMGLLASDLIDIEETNVQLNVESYMEDGLLGTTIVRGRMTLFIDIFRLVEKADPEWFSDRRKKSPPPEELKQILLVEDASFFRQLIKGYLEADGYKVTTAENGKIALDCFRKNDFDLIVSDIEMPVMDGWEFLKNIRQDKALKDIPAVALTALNSDKDREKAIECGYNRYEVKIDREHFLTTVAKLLN